MGPQGLLMLTGVKKSQNSPARCAGGVWANVLCEGHRWETWAMGYPRPSVSHSLLNNVCVYIYIYLRQRNLQVETDSQTWKMPLWLPKVKGVVSLGALGEQTQALLYSVGRQQGPGV